MPSSVSRSQRAKLRGKTEPRLFTKPLRELTPETSHGFSVIAFALDVLGITLYPWQKWLLIHALELNEDGTYRFRKVFVIVGRQNGKTTLLTVLTLWWLFMDADSFPEHLPAREFLVLGIAQNLDIAEEAWDAAVKRCDPDPDEDDEVLVVEDLAAEARKPVKTNGKKSLRLKSGAAYEPRAASRAGGRGKSAARVLMDEMREQQTWDAWGAVSKTKNAIFNSQLWGISSAGDAKSVVLRALRDGAWKTIREYEEYVETGLQSLEEFANTHDIATALFEWSAPEDSDLLDIDGILQSNPSIGYKPMFFESIWSDLLGDEDEAVKRTEILGLWVVTRATPFLDGEDWLAAADAPRIDERGQVVSVGSQIADDSHMVIGVDTWTVKSGRPRTYISVAGYRDDGRRHIELIAQRAGTLWVVDYVVEVAKAHGIQHVALQSRGAPAAEFKAALEKEGLTVIEIVGTDLLLSAGVLRDRLRDDLVRHRSQPALNLSAGGAVTKMLNAMPVWDRPASVVDAAAIVSATNALFGLENTEKPEPVRSAYEDHDLLVV